MVLKGTVASSGYAIGRARLLDSTCMTFKDTVEDVHAEIERVEEALRSSLAMVEGYRLKALESLGEHEAAIFESHQMMLEDPLLLEDLTTWIIKQEGSAEKAVDEILTLYADRFRALDSEYLRERALDMLDLKKYIWQSLSGSENAVDETSNELQILISGDITPSDTMQMDLALLGGFIMEKGGKTSHTSILAQSMNLPAVIGIEKITEQVQQNDLVIIDGHEGRVYVHPDNDTVKRYQELMLEEQQKQEALKKWIGQPSITLDGYEVEIAANIAGPQEIDVCHENDAEGIGLFRTEFLYMNRKKLPDEDEQFEIYRAVFEGMKGKPVIIRTMDIGGDKEVDYMHLPKEENPFLGYRAIRICLKDKDLFKTQLRAIYRASLYGNPKIMFPMISTLPELFEAKAICQEVREELLKEGYSIKENVPLGIMIEVPSTAIRAEVFGEHVDFFSIGTNDLTQYTLAVDRQNQHIQDLYDYFDPAVLWLINHVIKAAHKTNTWVGMCGAAAGDEAMIPVLLGMGIHEISMAPNCVLPSRKLVNNLHTDLLKTLVEMILQAMDAKEAKTLAKRFITQIDPK